jgi:drug/metabolite transporter (DMT)-like permease
MVVVFYFPLVSMPLVAPAVALDPIVPAGVEWVFLLLLGVFAQLGQVHMTEGLQREPAGRATAMMYLQVALGYAWGLLVFGDRLDLPGIAGAILVLAGIWIVSAAGRG